MLRMRFAYASRKVLPRRRDRKSTRLNSSHLVISYAVFCLKKKKKHKEHRFACDIPTLETVAAAHSLQPRSTELRMKLVTVAQLRACRAPVDRHDSLAGIES